MALKLGDPTARDMGRLTLNPIPHIDPIGSILVPLISFVAAGTVFIAWAKPVPVNPANFRNIRRDDILVSVIGPVSNLVVALFCVIMFIVTQRVMGPTNLISAGFGQDAASYFANMFYVGIPLNIFLAVFNLIPVPPLDGSHVVASLLPPNVANRYRQIGFAGILLIIIMMRLAPVWHAVLATVHFVLVPYMVILDFFR
jgi:Zn-dependent proteases